MDEDVACGDLNFIIHYFSFLIIRYKTCSKKKKIRYKTANYLHKLSANKKKKTYYKLISVIICGNVQVHCLWDRNEVST